MVLAEDVVAAEPGARASTTRRWTASRCAAADTRGGAPGSPVALTPERGVARRRARRARASARARRSRSRPGRWFPTGADAVRPCRGHRLAGRRACWSRPRSSPGATSAAPARTSRAGADGAARRAPGSARPSSACSPRSDATRSRCAPPPAGARCCVSGDELLEPGEPMRPGGVRNSNAYTLAALAERGGAEVCGVERVADDARGDARGDRRRRSRPTSVADLRRRLGRRARPRQGRASPSSASRSVFWGVALKPGRPTWFGTRGDDARLRPAGQPGLGDGHLPAARRARR